MVGKWSPVLILVLAFVVLSGCRRKEVLDLSELEAEQIAAEIEADAAAAHEGNENTAVGIRGNENIAKADSGSAGVPETEPTGIVVHICGAVEVPGVYELPAGSRIRDAVECAGGLTAEASEKSVNQAALLQDGVQIVILTTEEAVMMENEPTSDDGRINLNTAEIQQLLTLPGIGETRARAILAYREANGGFSSIEEIMCVNGIKEGSFAKLRDYITVR